MTFAVWPFILYKINISA